MHAHRSAHPRGSPRPRVLRPGAGPACTATRPRSPAKPGHLFLTAKFEAGTKLTLDNLGVGVIYIGQQDGERGWSNTRQGAGKRKIGGLAGTK